MTPATAHEPRTFSSTPEGASSSIQISKTVTILRKRPCPVQSSSMLGKRRRLRPVQDALIKLDLEVSSVHERQQQAALRLVIQALKNRIPPGFLSTVCLHTGTSAAVGDSSGFEAVVRHVQKTLCVHVVTLHPSRHDSLRSIADALEQASEQSENTNSQGRFVVAVQLAHLFHPDLLSDLVYLLAHKSKSVAFEDQTDHNGNETNEKIPNIAAIFAIPHATALHDVLNLGDAATLRTTLVRMPTQHEAFVGVIEALSSFKGVIFTQLIFHLLRTHFIQHDTSLAMVTRTLRQLTTLHFASSPLVDLLVHIDDDSEDARASILEMLEQPEILQLVDALPSVRSAPPQTFSDDCDEDRAKQYSFCIQALSKWKRDLCRLQHLALELDHIFSDDGVDRANGNGNGNANFSNNSNVGIGINPYDDIKQICTPKVMTFAAFLPVQNATTTQQQLQPGASTLTKALNFIRTAQRIDIHRILDTIINHLESTTPEQANMDIEENKSNKTADDLFIKRAQSMKSQLDEANTNNVEPVINNTPTTPATRANSSLLATTTMATPPSTRRLNMTTPPSSKGRRHATGGQAAMERRRAALRQNIVSSQQRRTPLNSVRNQLSILLGEIYARVKPIQSLRCHEIILFSDIEKLRVAAGGLCAGAQPRSSIFAALRAPARFLTGDKIDENEDNEEKEELKMEDHMVPDNVTAFRILAQGGRLVSLYDWYNVFASTVSATAIARKLPAVTTAETQARFARACSELELLGLIKYTNRKADHVARLAYE